LADRLCGKFAQSFDLKIAPQASCFASLRQPIELVLDTIGEQTAALATPTGSDDHGSPRAVAPQPCEKAPPFGIAFQPIQAQFDGGRFAPRAVELHSHLACCRGRNYGTDASDTFAK
jgi:hypothetical protein